MILEFFRFELRQQLRAPLLWLMALMFGLFAFGASTSDAIRIGSAIGNVDRNAPTVIVTFLGMFTVMGLLVTVTFVGNALLRDFELGTADLFFSAPMRKRDFLVGRFLAAVVACTLIYLMVAVGLAIGPLMPWVDPDRVQAFSIAPYAWGLGVLVLPNLLFTSALLALVAVTLRSMLVVYLGVIGLFVLYAVSGTLTAELDNVWLATLLDPLGGTALDWTVRYWSAEERNSRLPELSGYLLANRAAWLLVAFGLASAAFALFKPQRSGTGKGLLRRRKAQPATTAAAPRSMSPAPRVAPASGAAATWTQWWRQWWFDTLGVFRGVPFLVMLAFALVNFFASASMGQVMYGTPIHPVTSQMLRALEGSYSFMLVFIVMFYAGELVWRERDARVSHVSDAMPVPDWLPLTTKMAALVAVVLAFQAAGGLAAVAFQLFKGHVRLEPAVYAGTLLLDSIPFVLMAGLALVLQVLSNNKFIGYALLITWLVLQATLGFLDFDHYLYQYGSAPGAPYSDMNGHGHFLVARLWFQSYWGACLLALLLVSAALWVRGASPGGRGRLRLARQRLAGGRGLALAASVVLFAGLGGFIFWNTNVRNEYVPGDVALDRQQRYEEQYRQYLDLPQPRITGVQTRVGLWPEEPRARIEGEYRLVNPHDAAIDEVHLQLMPDMATHSVEMGAMELVHDDGQAGYRIYRLTEPMQPGEERTMRFDLEWKQDGFANHTAPTELVGNGTFFNSAVLPGFGYDPSRQIQDRNERRKRGMPELPRMAKLEDAAARANTYVSDDADWIDFRTSVCTAPDQIALAPGLLQREYERDGRRCFDYAMQRPMLNFHATLSARWDVRRGEYRGAGRTIPIEVYYDPRHDYNIDRMIESVQQSLAYFEASFGPYQHEQVRILEFPGYRSFAQAFAGTIPYSESIGFIADLRDEDAIDYVFYVTAHEIAHQWWAHQVIGGDVQGSTMLSESLAQYSALMVMEKAYGRGKMRRFLKYELDRYLAGRGGEAIEENPLYRVENQPYVHYRKGSLVFYRLREEIGEEALNRALHRFVADKGYQRAPFTTSAELLEYIRAEAGPEHDRLITDLFEKISFYDNRVESVAAVRRADGRYELVLDLHAAKRYADGTGRETEAALDDWIEVGVFARGASGKEADEQVLYLERHHITAADPRVTVVVDELPYEVGFDPYNKLIDRVSSDNRKRVSL